MIRVEVPGSSFMLCLGPGPSSLLHLTRANAEKPYAGDTGVKKNLLSYLFCSHKFHKIENYFIFEMPKKKNCSNFQRIIKLFTQKIVT